MKKLLTIACLVAIALTLTGASRRRGDLMQQSSATSACSTVHAQNATAETSITAIGTTTNNVFSGLGQHNPGANISPCGVTWIMTKDSGDISGLTYTCVAYAMSGNDFTGTVLATSTGILGTNTWSGTSVFFPWSSPPSLANGGSYAIALTTGTFDAANFARFSVSASGGISGSFFGWKSNGVYQTGFSTSDPRITIYVP